MKRTSNEQTAKPSVSMCTVVHKKRGSIFVIITLDNLDGFK